jgi:hypothetical protein
MMQEIIVWIIITMAFAYTIYSLIKTIVTKPKSNCDTGCCGCDAKKDIMKQVEYKKLRLASKD